MQPFFSSFTDLPLVISQLPAASSSTGPIVTPQGGLGFFDCFAKATIIHALLFTVTQPPLDFLSGNVAPVPAAVPSASPVLASNPSPTQASATVPDGTNSEADKINGTCIYTDFANSEAVHYRCCFSARSSPQAVHSECRSH
jgi:hypothetical protein